MGARTMGLGNLHNNLLIARLFSLLAVTLILGVFFLTSTVKGLLIGGVFGFIIQHIGFKIADACYPIGIFSKYNTHGCRI